MTPIKLSHFKRHSLVVDISNQCTSIYHQFLWEWYAFTPKANEEAIANGEWCFSPEEAESKGYSYAVSRKTGLGFKLCEGGANA